MMYISAVRISGGKKHLVHGGSGQLGMCLIRYLQSVGRGVRTIVRNPDRLYEAGLTEGIEALQADYDNVWLLRQIIEGSSVVYFCSTKWITEGYEAIQEMQWVERVANACLEHDVRLIVPSCTWAYGSPGLKPKSESHPLAAQFPYGAAKASVEHVVTKLNKISGLPVTVLRLPPLWGPFARCPVSINPMRAVARGRMFPLIGNGEAMVEWLDPRDGARIMAQCAEDDRTIGSIFNVPGSGAIKWSEFATWVTQVAGTGAKVRQVPGGLVGRLLGQSGFEQTLSWWYKSGLVVDGSAIQTDIGFSHTYSLKQSIVDAWHWYANQRPEARYTFD